MTINLNDLARLDAVNKLAAKVSARLNSLDGITFKAVNLVDNTINFFASSDTTQTPAYAINIPAEQFLDQASTSFVPNFMFSGLAYAGATNPNLDGKPVIVLGVKTKSNDGNTENISYSFIDVSHLVDTYTASDTSITISDYKVKANISPDAGNSLKLKSNGLYAGGVTDTATTSTTGLMSAADKSKLDGINLSNYVEKVAGKSLSTNDFTTSEKNKLDSIADSAQVNVIESVKVNNTALTVSNKSVNIDLANYATKSDLNSKLDSNAKAASASTADSAGAVSGENATTNVYRHVWFSDNLDEAKRVYSDDFQYNPSSKSLEVSSITGTANNVTGIVAVANGGTGQTSLDNVSVGAATKATQDGNGNIIANTYVTKSTFNKWTHPLTYGTFGFRIDKNESDPDARVEYILDAVGMTPAFMDFNNGSFNYGSWANAWFIKGNKPCMLKSDGSVDYYLDPNDYSKKIDGSASDVANSSYDGNAMAQIPLCWVYRYEDDNYLYEIVSPVKIDDNYKAYAHTDSSGNIKDFCYHSMFGASGSASKLRSLSGQSLAPNLSIANMVSGATANGSGWYIGYWSQRSLINTLLILLSKSTNSQSSFGNGNARASTSTSALLPTGTLNNNGQFSGSTATNQQVKIFHIESYYGDQWLRTAGLINSYGTLYAKMTPEGDGYRISDVNGYSDTGTRPNASPAAGSLRDVHCNHFGLTPIRCSQTETFFNAYSCISNSNFNYATCGGAISFGGGGPSAFSISIADVYSKAANHFGCHLSFV